MTTANRLRIKSMADSGDARAQTMMNILDDSSKMLSVILIGNNIVNISASSMATTLTMRLFGNAAVSITTGVLTLLVLIFGEITPKTLATIHAEKLSLAYAPIIWRLMVIMTPLVFIVDKLSSAVLALLRVDTSTPTDTVTEEDIRTLVEAGREEGVLEKQEHEIITNVFDFGDAEVCDVMVPRADMITVCINDSYDDIFNVYRTEKLSRLPVYEDDRSNIVGVINIKDFVFYDRQNGFHIRDILYQPYFTYENKKISELLLEMREKSFSLTIVLDEYGSAVGMITLEDLLEELVGQIRDEYDEDEKDLIQKLTDREYLIEGSVKLDDVNDMIGLTLESEDYDSIGGYIIGQLEKLPQTGDTVLTPEGVRLTVEKMHRNRIEKVRLLLPKEESPAETEILEATDN